MFRIQEWDSCNNAVLCLTTFMDRRGNGGRASSGCFDTAITAEALNLKTNLSTDEWMSAQVSGRVRSYPQKQGKLETHASEFVVRLRVDEWTSQRVWTPNVEQ